VKNFQIFWISLHVLDTTIDCTIETRHKPPPVTNIEFLAQMKNIIIFPIATGRSSLICSDGITET